MPRGQGCHFAGAAGVKASVRVGMTTTPCHSAFASVEYVQMGIVALLAVGAATLPRFTKAA